ncbi:MAG: cell division ATPase MinD [Candidatus Aenigmatarchaeota archaeon]
MEKNTRIIGIISGKGGVGKTTVVANLGAVLAQKFKKEVVIIDCNLTTSHLSLSLGMYYCPITLNNILRGEKNIFDGMYDHPSGMKIIPASLHLRELENVDIAKLKDVIKELKGKVDFIILDASPGLGREAFATIHASEEIIFVTNPNIPAATDIIKCKEIIKDFNKRPLGLVLNMVNKKGYELTKREVEVLTEVPVIASIPNDKNVHKSLAHRLPVIMFKPRSKASKEIIKLARYLLGEKEEGIFNKIFKK